jgi:hypothetical protein
MIGSNKLSAYLRSGIPKRDIDVLEHYRQILPSLPNALFVAAY